MLIQTTPPLIELRSGEGILVRRVNGEYQNVKDSSSQPARKEKMKPALLLPPAPVAFLKPRKWDYL
jgi:hypothetical protein